MDYLIYFFILIIVIATGYILSRPFIKSINNVPTSHTIELQGQYQALLEEIRQLMSDCESGAIPIDDCSQQIKEKKRMAADLLRDMDSQTRTAVIAAGQNKPINGENRESLAGDPSTSGHYCPQCAGQVISSDKFCMHCGHRLRP